MNTPQLIQFLKTIGGLKNIERFRGQYYWKDYKQQSRYESVADHTWRMAILLILVEKKLSQPMDFSKAMKMLLLHDIAEVITGDLSPLGSDGTGNDAHLYNKDKAKEKHNNEKTAAEKLFSNLPPALGKELYDLWTESEELHSFESKVVKAIDKIEGKLQAAEYAGGQMDPTHLEFSLKYGNEKLTFDPLIESLGEEVNKELKGENNLS